MYFAQPLSADDLGERRGQSGLAVVDVPDGADVHVRFASIEFFFGHVNDPRACCHVPAATPPSFISASAGNVSGADVQNRTGDLVLTKDALCQLSYIGLRLRLRPTSRLRAFGVRPRLGRQPSSPRCHAGLPAVARADSASEGWSGRRGSNPRPTAWKAVTLPLSYSRHSRSLRITLRRGKPGHLVTNWLNSPCCVCNQPIVGQPTDAPTRPACFAVARIGGEGRTRTFEAARATDLQSAAFDRFATSPAVCVCLETCCFPERFQCRWSWRRDLNPRPADYKSAALPA